MDLVHQLDDRTYGIASCDPLLVVVQPAHDRKSDQLIPCILSGKNRSALLWDLLRNPLMGSCLIEVDHIRIEHTLELLLMQDQQMRHSCLTLRKKRSQIALGRFA